MSHPYDKAAHCQCARCTKERARRAAQSAVSAPKPKLRSPKRAAIKEASREEQHGRYIDCGPGAWDDRE